MSADFFKWKSCERKKAFATESDALNHNSGQTAYRCRFCKKWHLSTDAVYKTIQWIRRAPKNRIPEEALKYQKRRI